MSVQYDGVKYEYRGYIYDVVEPKKNEITGIALNHLRDFIENLEFEKEMDDWRLTKRQNQAMHLFVKGSSNKEVCGVMDIKMTTLKTFLDSIYTTYGVNDKLNAVLTFLKNTRGEDESSGNN